MTIDLVKLLDIEALINIQLLEPTMMLDKYFAYYPDKIPYIKTKIFLQKELNKYIENRKYFLHLVATLFKNEKLYAMIHINIKVRIVVKLLFLKILFPTGILARAIFLLL